jgi:hypothetical protein
MSTHTVDNINDAHAVISKLMHEYGIIGKIWRREDFAETQEPYTYDLQDVDFANKIEQAMNYAYDGLSDATEGDWWVISDALERAFS